MKNYNTPAVVACLLIALFVSCAVTFCSRASPATANSSNLIVVKGGRLIDGNGNAPIENSVVVIEGERIRGVFREGQFTIPAGATIIDAKGKSILPGLIDVHVHFGGIPGAGTSPDEYGQVRRLHDLKAFLFCGVTTFKSLGDDQQRILALRRRESVEHRLSPRIFAVGRIFTAPGGHPAGTIFAGMQKDVVDGMVFQVDTEDQVRDAIKTQVADHVDGIKIVYDGGFADHPIPRLKPELLRLIISEAHKNGLVVSVHCFTGDDIKESVAAGADGIEHAEAEGLTDETLKIMAKRGVYFTPTLVVYDQWVKLIKGVNPGNDSLVRGCVSPGLLKGLAEYQSKLIEAIKKSPQTDSFSENRLESAKLNTRRAQAAGVKICAGTDAGNKGVFFGPSLHQELALMVEAGMTPLQAITAGTRNAAAYIGALDRIGTIEAGKLADLLIVDGDPSKDISATTRIAMVFKGGEMIKRDELFGTPTQ